MLSCRSQHCRQPIIPRVADRAKDALLPRIRYVSNNPLNGVDPSGLYDEAGHFYTTYIVAVIVGYNESEAFELAYYSQLPDEVKDFDAVKNTTHRAPKAAASGLVEKAGAFGRNLWNGLAGRPNTNPFGGSMAGNAHKAAEEMAFARDTFELLHSLHGGGPEEVRKRQIALRQMIAERDESGQLRHGSWQTGMLIHALSDSFAHTFVKDGKRYAYKWPEGHALTKEGGHAPDIIPYDFANYNNYIDALANALSERLRGDTPNEDQMKDLNHFMSTVRKAPIATDQGASAREWMRELAVKVWQLPEFYKPEDSSTATLKEYRTPAKSHVQDLLDAVYGKLYGERASYLRILERRKIQ